MTRWGTDALKEQLWAEAMRHGLGRANEVLIVADGAAWIWNLASDRFAGARQRVDFYHVSQHLWAVAHVLHPDDEAAAKGWVEPMLDKLKQDASCEVITDLEQPRQRLEGPVREQVEKEVKALRCFQWNGKLARNHAVRTVLPAWRENGARMEPSLSKRRHPFGKIEFHISLDKRKKGW